MKINIAKLPLRVIVLPFVMIITFCYSMWQLIDYWINFIIYGGEFIALNKKRTKATIAETYDRVQEMTDRQKISECSHYIGSSRSVKDGVESAQCIKCKEWFVIEPKTKESEIGLDAFTEFTKSIFDGVKQSEGRAFWAGVNFLTNMDDDMFLKAYYGNLILTDSKGMEYIFKRLKEIKSKQTLITL